MGKVGFFPERINREKMTPAGIGGQAGSTTTGKKLSPCRALGSLGAVSGTLESHRLKDQGRAPFWLSLNARAALGLAKDFARGVRALPH